MEQKIEKKSFVFKIIAFELGITNSRNIEQATCPRQSMCQEISLRFDLIVLENFSRSLSLRMIKNTIKLLRWRFCKYLEHFHRLTVKAFFEMTFFRECSNQDFYSLWLRKYISFGDHPFIKKCLKFDIDSMNGTKNWEKFFCFEIIAFELGVTNSRNIEQAGDVLRNILEIWLNSTRDHFQINFSQYDENTW